MLHLQTGNVNRSAISSGAFAVFPLEIHWIQSWNTPPCLWNSKLRYPPTSSEFQSKKPPLSLGIPRCRPWYGMDIFWNHPLVHASLSNPKHSIRHIGSGRCTSRNRSLIWSAGSLCPPDVLTGAPISQQGGPWTPQGKILVRTLYITMHCWTFAQNVLHQITVSTIHLLTG